MLDFFTFGITICCLYNPFLNIILLVKSWVTSPGLLEVFTRVSALYSHSSHFLFSSFRGTSERSERDPKDKKN